MIAITVTIPIFPISLSRHTSHPIEDIWGQELRTSCLDLPLTLYHRSSGQLLQPRDTQRKGSRPRNCASASDTSTGSSPPRLCRPARTYLKTRGRLDKRGGDVHGHAVRKPGDYEGRPQGSPLHRATLEGAWQVGSRRPKR